MMQGGERGRRPLRTIQLPAHLSTYLEDGKDMTPRRFSRDDGGSQGGCFPNLTYKNLHT